MKEILFLHDALGSGEQFANLDTVLAGKFKIYTFNFSGHGRRPSHQHAFTVQNFTHELLDWMNEQYIHSIDIFGYGLGGYVALWLARFYPERAGKIFTLGTKLTWNEAEAVKEIKLLNPDITVAQVPEFAKSLAQLHGEHEWKSLMSKTGLMMKDLAHTHLTDRDFVRIQHTILLCLGENDDRVTKEEINYAHRLLKKSQIKIYPGIPHSIEQIPVSLLEREIAGYFGVQKNCAVKFR